MVMATTQELAMMRTPPPLMLNVVGEDDEGDRITSCVVTSDTAAQEIRRVQLPRGGNQKIVLDALRSAGAP
jgi:hypothetical protein